MKKMSPHKKLNILIAFYYFMCRNLRGKRKIHIIAKEPLKFLILHKRKFLPGIIKRNYY